MRKMVFVLVGIAIVALPLVVVAQTDPVSGGFNVAQNIGGGSLGTTPLRDVMVAIVNILLGFLGIAAVLVIIFGIAYSAAAAGDDERIAAGRRTAIAGAIGLGIILGTFVIARFVVNNLTAATNGTAAF